MAWLFRCLLASSCARLAVAERRISDGDVLQSLEPYLLDWTHNVFVGNVSLCRLLYLEDASLLAELGPAAGVMLENAGLEDPVLKRGRDAIAGFWLSFAHGAGTSMSGLRVYEPEGPYARSTLVVDDNTVIAAGPFALPKLKGRVLSSTWVRASASGDWRIKSDMIQVEFSALPIVQREHPHEEGVLAEKAPPSDTPVESALEDAPPKQDMPRYYYHGPQPNSTEMETIDAKAAGGGGPLVWVLATLAIGLGLFYAVRAHRRRAAMRTIGGPDTLLG